MNDISCEPITLGRVAPMLPVPDMEAALQFYQSVFGFEKAFENGDPASFMILERDAAELHLTLQPGHRPPDFNAAHILVSDTETLHQRCQDAGAQIIKRLKNKDYGLKAFVFEDPFGNRIDVGEPI
jgi:predicted enzyme related to lactoylglutathione lyase